MLVGAESLCGRAVTSGGGIAKVELYRKIVGLKQIERKRNGLLLFNKSFLDIFTLKNGLFATSAHILNTKFI